jgi:hypothetical protein
MTGRAEAHVMEAPPDPNTAGRSYGTGAAAQSASSIAARCHLAEDHALKQRRFAEAAERFNPRQVFENES